MGHFKIIKITDLKEVQIDDVIPESDFSTVTPENKFVQMEYIREKETKDRIKLEPGIWKICSSQQKGYYFEQTSFTVDKILDKYVKTKEIEDCVDTFFKNIDLYAEFGIEVPKRNLMIYGPGGTGKSTSITKICNKYIKDDDKMAVVVWHTSTFQPQEIKPLFSNIDYSNIERMILVVEDLGGVEAKESRMNSDSALLALLDNSEKSFEKPICIVATTNFPEMFLGNILDRPGRFDDKIKVGYPSKEARSELLAFFSKNTATQEELDLIKTKPFDSFSPAHIRECYVRARLKSKTISETLEEVRKEQQIFNKAFNENTATFGLNRD